MFDLVKGGARIFIIFLREGLTLNPFNELVKHLSANFVVLEQPKACTCGTHNDRSAFTNIQAISKSFFKRWENGSFDSRFIHASLFQISKHALGGRADERYTLQVRALLHENF